MYAKNKLTATLIHNADIEIGETMEMKMRRILTTGEPIKDSAPEIYTERKNGVMPQYNIRTDRWEIAALSTENDAKTKLAKRAEALKAREEAENPQKPAEPTV